MITVSENIVIEELTREPIALCIDEDPVDLTTLLGDDYVEGGTWTDVDQSGGLSGDVFDPFIVNLENFKFSYTEPGDCGRVISVFVNVHADCVVLPCETPESFDISKVVTANNDGDNDTFAVTNIENCGFIEVVTMLNRWGKVVYHSDNYQDDWSGYHDNSGMTVSSDSKLPSGTYYYVVNIIGSGFEPITGYIYLGTH
jgi:gliding motility-associated-like protein